MVTRRHSAHIDGRPAELAAIENTIRYDDTITTEDSLGKQMSEPMSMTIPMPMPIPEPPMVVGSMEDSDLLLSMSSPTTHSKKKRSKTKDKTKKSKQKHKSSSSGSVSNHTTISDVDSEILSPSGSVKESKKKKRGKKFRYNSEALGVIFLPDCDDERCDDERDLYDISAHFSATDCYDDEKDVHDKSAHFSAYTEETTLLEDDDLTAVTKEEVKPRKSPKKGKKLMKDKRSKSQSKSDLKLRLSSPKGHRKKGTTTDAAAADDNESSAAAESTPKSSQKDSLSPELLNLLMDPSLKIGSRKPLSKSKSSSKRSSGLKKSNSFNRPSNEPVNTLGSTRRRSSVGNLKASTLLGAMTSESKHNDRPTRRKSKKEATTSGNSINGNASWGVDLLNSNSSFSPELLNLYTNNSRESEKQQPSTMLRRNVKSYGNMGMNESWRTDPKRDNDIPSILFLTTENSHCNLNEPWDGQSSRNVRPPSLVRRKETVNGSSNELWGEEGLATMRSPSMTNVKGTPLWREGDITPRNKDLLTNIKRNELWGSSPIRHAKKPSVPLPMSMRKEGGTHGNDSWVVDSTRSSPNSAQLSPEIRSMLLSSAAMNNTNEYGHKVKSPGRMKKSISFGAMRKSPSLGGIKNSFANFKKLRGIKEKNAAPNAIPNLAN